MAPSRPAALVGATWLSAAVVAMTGLIALLTVVFKDELVDAWAAGRTDSGTLQPPAFVPVALTLFVVVALLSVVLISFLYEGHEWARIVMSAVVALVAVATLAILRTVPPPLFFVVAALSLFVDVAAVLALWHRETRAFCRRPHPAPRADVR